MERSRRTGMVVDSMTWRRPDPRWDVEREEIFAALRRELGLDVLQLFGELVGSVWRGLRGRWTATRCGSSRWSVGRGSG